ncbi:MAG: outer membrane protein assembly factor BamD [Alphaproteobacteria bacterium]|nr:outer membrane protein assembly factor BamD [Alphaproteobacteria bacterium]
MNSGKNMKFLVTSLLILIALSGCQSKKRDDGVLVVDAEQLYNDGIVLFKSSKYYDASVKFGDIYFQHPGNSLTPYAEIMESYSLYKAKKYLDAIDVIDNFLVLHPSHEDISYILYLKALCYYDQISDIHHDQEITKKARESFESLIFRYPDSKYSEDAKVKLALSLNQLAAKELYIGKYYQRLLNPVAAINRFNEVVTKYKTTEHVPEALFRIVESYLALGLMEEAKNYSQILERQYPGNIWTKHSYQLSQKK